MRADFLDRIRSLSEEARVTLDFDTGLIRLTHIFLLLTDALEADGWQDVTLDFDKRVIQSMVSDHYKNPIPVIGFEVGRFTVNNEMRFGLAGMTGEAFREGTPGEIPMFYVHAGRGPGFKHDAVYKVWTSMAGSLRSPRWTSHIEPLVIGLPITEAEVLREVLPRITPIRRPRAVR